MRGFLEKCNIHQGNRNNQKRSYNQKSGIQINKCCFAHSLFFLANAKSYVNHNMPAKLFSGIKFGVNTIKPIAPADKLTIRPDSAVKNDLLFKNLFILDKYQY